MADTLTAEERAAIEAFPASQITRVPRGTSAYQMTWDSAKNNIRYVDPDMAKAQFRGPGKKKDPAVAARRQKVKDMAEAGKSGAEIAEALGVKLTLVYSDARAVGATISRSAAARHRYSDHVSEIRDKIRGAFDGERSASEIARVVGVSARTAADHLSALGLEAPHGKPGRAADREVEERRAKIPALIEEGLSGPQIAERLGASRAVIHNDCQAIGVKIPRGRRRPNTGSDKAGDRKAAAAEKKRATVRDRRRFKTAPVPTGEAKVTAPADATGTLFPVKVADPTEADTILKDGANSVKIGGDVLVGRLKGAKILTLTLEERATCPRACALWQTCYGNGMPRATRWRHGPDLEDRIADEVAAALEEHEQVLVRLHVLGDFYSVDYVQFWEALIAAHDGLHAFGFTAWGPDTAIGAEVAAVRDANPDRFMIRHSGVCAPWGSFTVDFPTERKRLGDAIVCPEQRGAMSGEDEKRHCGNCGVCWAADAPIVFVEH